MTYVCPVHVDELVEFERAAAHPLGAGTTRSRIDCGRSVCSAGGMNRPFATLQNSEWGKTSALLPILAPRFSTVFFQSGKPPGKRRA